ncbi:ribosomal protein S7 [Orientia chuto str. Dubai]|uniref:Small ribosomal subunit protein uS7 n=1 Tax=Orientia chuto str. Dubai TaxID=1359168 RepID=A0A0F3MPJ3_9RICK|nr:30S ribosomal protein S7 [Candidatus Orientia mediorientalis]KJV56534.1 ribosomal protein S7 [Orientia chuto str. Dubai]
MSRRSTEIKRRLLPSYQNMSAGTDNQRMLVGKFINKLIRNGNKELIEKMLNKIIQYIQQKYKTDGYEMLEVACNNVKPSLQVESLRLGGATYQVPSPVSESRSYTLAIKWIINAAANRTFEKHTWQKIAEELYEASNGRGGAIKKKDDNHKMAEANQAFAHLITRRRSRGN